MSVITFLNELEKIAPGQKKCWHCFCDALWVMGSDGWWFWWCKAILYWKQHDRASQKTKVVLINSVTISSPPITEGELPKTKLDRLEHLKGSHKPVEILAQNTK